MSSENQSLLIESTASLAGPAGPDAKAEPSLAALVIERVGVEGLAPRNDRAAARDTPSPTAVMPPLPGRPRSSRPMRLARRAKRLIARACSRLLGRPTALDEHARLILTSGLMDPAWYAREYADVADRGEDAAAHYLRHGVDERRDPGPHFSTGHYLGLFADRRHGEVPLLHFLDRVAQYRARMSVELAGAVETVPPVLDVGLGTVLFVKGWCYVAEARLRSLDLRLGARTHRVVDHSHPRADIFERVVESYPSVEAFFSGFATHVAFAPSEAGRTLSLTLVATLDDGRVLEKPVANLVLRGGTGASSGAVAWPSDGAKVAICMATHEPPLPLFERQIASIKAQTHANWICILSDDGSSKAIRAAMARLIEGDSRFRLDAHATRVGFYRNFERALQACPKDADFIALSDQDDRWYPDKITTLLGVFAPDTQLAYADVRIVGEDGTIRSDTFWVTRANNFTSLAALLSANTVIGAASMFRVSLLDAALPFPERLGAAYHDHWIALNALARGSIVYVDRPLHDYVQHGANVIGHKHDQDAPGLRDAVASLAGAWRSPSEFTRCCRKLLDQAVLDRYGLVAQKIVLARILLIRHPGMTDMKRSILSRFAALERLSVALRERFAAAIDKRPTLNHEGFFLRAVLGNALRVAYSDVRRGRMERHWFKEKNRRAAMNFFIQNNSEAPISFAASTKGRIVPAMAFGDVSWIFANIAPLRLAVAAAQPRRVNLLLATINFDYLFGGYIGMFNLALRLRREGYRVRIVLLEKTDVDLPAWRAKIQKYPGLTDLFDVVELEYRHDRSLDLGVNPDDAFVATSGWSAHVAHQAMQDLSARPFVFMVQEYEPFFGPMNSSTAILRQAYDFPQFALFSTDILRDYFAANRIGVFERPDGAARSAAFRNAIQPFAPTRVSLTRPTRRILFYARPEAHAARNLFELGIASLVALFGDSGLDLVDWSVHGIGSIKSDNRLELKPGVLLQMVPKTSLQDYAAMLPGFDVGLSLMMTPHPSLVPLEMAAAGLWTVTNTFANKTAERLSGISTNLIGVPPTLDGIVAGLRQAISRVEDIDGRLAGARIDWPTDWDRAFDPAAIGKLKDWLGPNEGSAERG